MRWLVTGASGMLARDVLAALGALGEDAVALDRTALDLTDASAVRETVAALRPHQVVNCAAWTAVDDAESREPEALAVNGTAVRHLATACAESGATLVHLSTDYVFAGDATAPYPESAAPAPRSAYGRTKLAGERAVRGLLPERGYVVRTAWLYGAGGRNFVRTMLDLERARPYVDVVTDQVGQPTWTADLAGQLVALARSGAPGGVYHGTASGQASWYDLAREVFRLAGADPDRVRPTTSAAYPRPAARPAYSVLGHARWAEAGLAPLRDWREALAEAVPAMAAAPPAEAVQSPATAPIAPA
ncbi:dTDP-4-dehydrorhamnose reductase [Streptomyces sp. NPDC046887]|uniref:dTDP-4-dehydrorhamnose reductase n=1 Tax=Streptomyces sp. NPDC046887 TaxID=3155472 RepID=UPI0033CBC594